MESDDPIKLGLTPQIVEGDIDAIRAEIGARQSTRRGRFAEKFILAAVSGIPWIGAYLVAAASLRDDEANHRVSELQTEWLNEHHDKLHDLQETVTEVDQRFEKLGKSITERIESPEYLGIVRKAFRIWDTVDTKEKREYISNLVINSGGTRLCSDDVIRLFADLIERYHEMHFAVIREISKNPGFSRNDVWVSLYNVDVRDDSAEADLFKLIFRDLSTGGMIRQERDTNQLGQFITKRSASLPKGYGMRTMKSAFDNKEAYVLTGMGRQFIHYTMNDAVTRIGASASADTNRSETSEPID
ncbi:MAG: hypothetical protein ABI291_02810 [Acidobacteriaceae bacterium]